jgi:hypothetical protein
VEEYRRLALQVLGGIAGVEQQEMVAVEQMMVEVGAVIKVMGVLGKVRQELRSIYRISDMMQLPYHTRDRTAYILNEAMKHYKVFLFIFYNKNMNV